MKSAQDFWIGARSRLAPVIGESGFQILFARSLHIARREHAWLARPAEATGDIFADLQASLGARPEGEAEAANRALTAHFVALLHSLIGEALTGRLLDFGAARPKHGVTPGDPE